MGSPTADKAAKFISEDQRKNTQLLLDIPAGHHKPTFKNTIIKGSQAAIGLAGETAYRMFFDEKTKDPDGRGKRLIEYLKTKKSIKDDNTYLTKLKTTLIAGVKLVRGTPLSYEKNTFIRNATLDPLTTGPERKKLVEKDLGKPIVTHSMKRREMHPEESSGKEPYPVQKAKVNVPFWQTGGALEAPVGDSTHFFFYRRRFKTWGNAIRYCQATEKKLPESA